MPTRIERIPSEHNQHDKLPANDPHNLNSHWVHKEALRVAIGSILAPKRPPLPTASSRSTSGTTSPYSFPASGSHTPGTGTPIHAEYLHPQHGFLVQGQHHHHHPHPYHLHPHTPSRLAHPSGGSPTGGSSPTAKPVDLPQPVGTQQHDGMRPIQNENIPKAEASKPVTEVVPAQRPNVSPLQPAAGGNVARASSLPADVPTTANRDKIISDVQQVASAGGRGTPKAKFIEKLQSKSAWDALIHGSFS